MTCGVYKITNNTSGKYYIGSSVNIQNRWNSHKSDLRKQKHGNDKLQKSFNKHVEEVFSFEILEICSPEEVRVIEQRYLDEAFHNPEVIYNLYRDAGGITSDQAIARNKEFWSNPDNKEKLSKLNAEIWSDEALLAENSHKVKTSLAKIDKESWHKNLIDSHNTPESRAIASKKAKLQWANNREKMMSIIGSEEHKAKMSVSVKTAHSDPEVKAKHKAALLNAMSSEAYSNNMSKALKRRFESEDARSKVRVSNPNRKSLIRSDGMVFYSIAQAAKVTGASVKSIKKATLRGRT